MKAYTLIEMLIVIAVLMVLTGLSSLSIVSFGQATDIDTAKTMVAGALKEARADSMADLNDKAWGIHLETGRLIIFPDSGTGFNPADKTNSVRVLPGKTSLAWDLIAGGENLLFRQRTGQVQNYGTLTVVSEAAEARTIIINQEGMIE